MIKSKGTYRDVIHGLFSPMLDDTALELDTKMFDAVKRELPREKDIENADAVIISGSFEDDAHEDKQVIWQRILESRVAWSSPLTQ